MYPLNNNMVRLPDGRIVTMEEAQRLRNMPINTVADRLPTTMANPVGGPEKIDILPTPVQKPYLASGRGGNPADFANPFPYAPEQANPTQPPKPTGLMDMISGGLARNGIDQSDLLMALGSGMLGLSQDQGLQQLGMSGFGQVQENRKARQAQGNINKTVQALKDAGREDLARAVASGMMPATEAAKILFDKPKEGEVVKQYKLAVEQGYPGTFLDFKKEIQKAGASTTTFGDTILKEADKDFYEKFREGQAKSINEMADRAPELVGSLNQIEMLQRLGQGLDANTAIPTWARPYVPEGISGALDAYNSVAYSVAQSLRVAGTGPMTDKDFEVLVRRAGSAALSPEARAIVQTGLRAAVQMNLDLSRAAQAFRSNPSNEARAEYEKKVEEILNRRLFTDEQQAMLDAYSGERMPIKAESVHGLDLPSGFLQSLEPEDYDVLRSGVMSKDDIEQAIQEWRQG